MMVRSIRPMLLVAGVLGFAQVQADEGYLNGAGVELCRSGAVTYLVDDPITEARAEEVTGKSQARLIEVGAGQRGLSELRAAS